MLCNHLCTSTSCATVQPCPWVSRESKRTLPQWCATSRTSLVLSQCTAGMHCMPIGAVSAQLPQTLSPMAVRSPIPYPHQVNHLQHLLSISFLACAAAVPVHGMTGCVGHKCSAPNLQGLQSLERMMPSSMLWLMSTWF